MIKEKLKKIAKASMKSAIKEVISFRYQKLHSLKFGLAGGIVAGLCILICSLIALTGSNQMMAALVYAMYGPLGYDLTAVGILLGTIYGFVEIFIVTYLFSWIYNKLL